jgi:uncharacterized coiled-coil protein SlyX
MSLGRRLRLAGFGVALATCACRTAPVLPQTARDSAGGGGGPSRSAARDSALEQRVARLELRLAERDAQLEELQTRLDEARQEVVRTMAKLQTVASRAEAASGMAEAEVAMQSLRAAAGAEPGNGADVAQASTLLQQASAEFAKQNYGGALYLANQAKSVAGIWRNRLGSADHAQLRPGEVAFSVPVKLQASARGNVRDGPGSAFKILFTVEPGAGLVGYSYLEQWVRVADASGRGGWMYLNLVGRRSPP